MRAQRKIAVEEVRFPPACAVCLGAPAGTTPVEYTVNYGRRSFQLSFDMPLCAEHLALATHKGAAERAVEWASLALGALAGLGAGGGLWSYWAASGQGSPWLNAPLALVVAAGAGLIVWATPRYFVAPRFASREQRAAREAVRVTQYDSTRHAVTLEIRNEAFAAWMEEEAEEQGA